MPNLRLVCCGQTCDLPAMVDLRGFLSFWLLWELRLGPLVGAQLAERLAWRRGTPVSNGTLYPALANLERQGMVKKRRRGRDTQYEVSSKGERELACARSYLQVILADVMEATP
jgi:PadR family transcriptional regulator, regulatory protein PadR